MVLAAYEAARAENLPFALATIVDVQGSSYRRPGTRMLIYADGRRFGSLSGGCLEADVAAHARNAITSGEPTVIRYDAHTANGDLILETGCKGAISILIQPIGAPDVAASLDFLQSLSQERRTGVIATLFAIEGRPDYRVGDCLMLSETQGALGALADTSLADRIASETARSEPQETNRTVSFALPGGSVQALVERRVPPIALLVCGAGHDTMPMVQIAAALGWQVTVADPNGSAVTAQRYPAAAALLPLRPECLPERMAMDCRVAAILMTHNYALDLEWFRRLLPSPAAYLGVLGPRQRWIQLQHELEAGGMTLSEHDRSRVHSPAGLDIGSETPEEIALAVVAEIQAVMRGRVGGFLRQRGSPIPAAGIAMPSSVSVVSRPQGATCPLSAS